MCIFFESDIQCLTHKDKFYNDVYFSNYYCPLCNDELDKQNDEQNDEQNNTIVYIPCRHKYHEKCIKPAMILESKLFRFSCVVCHQKIPLELMLYSLKNPYYHS